MEKQKIESFKVIGISVRTTNERGQAGTDIAALWNQFIAEGLIEKIPNKIEHNIYCIYTEYEKDHTKPYTTILGCKVDNLDIVPTGFTGMTFKGGNYVKRVVKGDINKGMVFEEWTKIWNSDIPRAFTADFEVYGDKAQNPENAEVDIFLAVQ